MFEVAFQTSEHYDLYSQVKGTWNGLVSHLNQEKSTIGWAHFFITASRAKLIDFTTPWDADRYCFFVCMFTFDVTKKFFIKSLNFSHGSLLGTPNG